MPFHPLPNPRENLMIDPESKQKKRILQRLIVFFHPLSMNVNGTRSEAA
jgi:hypothetical protein